MSIPIRDLLNFIPPNVTASMILMFMMWILVTILAVSSLIPKNRGPIILAAGFAWIMSLYGVIICFATGTLWVDSVVLILLAIVLTVAIRRR